MEAQGYRDSQSLATSKTTQSKKKIQEVQINYENLNKDCCGALVTLSKKSVERAAAHIKTDFSNAYPQKDTRPPNIFVRPMLPKIITRAEKISPKKDNEDAKELPSPSPVKAKEYPAASLAKAFPAPSPVKEVTAPVREVTTLVKEVTTPVKEVTTLVKEVATPVKEVTTPLKEVTTPIKEVTAPVKDITTPVKELTTPIKEVTIPRKVPFEEPSNVKDEVTLNVETNSQTVLKTEDDTKTEIDSKIEIEPKTEIVQSALSSKEQTSLNLKNKLNELVKPKSLPSIVPLKFRRQSLEVMKNPIINKNITDFTKSGLKTKILVIKPINRNKDGTHKLNSPLKFQTIKLKDPNKRSSKDDQDQVVVVKVPKVDCTITRPVTDVSNKSKEQLAPASSSKSLLDIATPKDDEIGTKSVENNDEISTVVPPNLEASNEPTELEESASNDNEDPKIIISESSIANDDTLIRNIIEEPVIDSVMDTSENVNTTE